MYIYIYIYTYIDIDDIVILDCAVIFVVSCVVMFGALHGASQYRRASIPEECVRITLYNHLDFSLSLSELLFLVL